MALANLQLSLLKQMCLPFFHSTLLCAFEQLQEKKVPSSLDLQRKNGLRCFGMTSAERNSFVKSNGGNFLLIVVQVLSAITGNVWWRLLLPKQGQHVIKTKGSYFIYPLLRMFNTEQAISFVFFKQTVFVDCCDSDGDQIKFYEQFMQNSTLQFLKVFFYLSRMLNTDYKKYAHDFKLQCELSRNNENSKICEKQEEEWFSLSM